MKKSIVPDLLSLMNEAQELLDESSQDVEEAGFPQRAEHMITLAMELRNMIHIAKGGKS